MLVSFSVENWQSYRDKVTFSTLATTGKRHLARIAKIQSYKKSILPIAAIYGANASGKTNLFNALAFAKDFIVEMAKPDIPIVPNYFKLDDDSANRPTCFEFILFAKENLYEFTFAIHKGEIIEEKLIEIKKNWNEEVLYHRHGQEIKFLEKLEKKDQRLNFVKEGTRPNQLFLSASVYQNMEHFKPVYDWFKRKLVLISPNTQFGNLGRLLDKEHSLHSFVNEQLNKFDTGINEIEFKESSPEALPDKLRQILLKEIPEGGTVSISLANPFLENKPLVVSKKGGELKVKKLSALHQSRQGKKIAFDFSEESAGTLRLFDLLPAFFSLTNIQPAEAKVFFIDELDRCLHALLTRQLLEDYLACCSAETRSQLVFTTHDVSLMNQKLFRSDEIWLAERDAHGCSSLIALSDYKAISKDKDIRKNYLRGHFGGIPKILYEPMNKKNN